MKNTLKDRNFYQSSPYRIIHYWIQRNKGKPKFCDKCHTTTSKRYEWANISGEYKIDLRDWARLCSKCHKQHDNHSIKVQHNYYLKKVLTIIFIIIIIWILTKPM